MAGGLWHATVPANVAKWKQKKTTGIPLSHQPEHKQMEPADVPKISFIPGNRLEVLLYLLNHEFHEGLIK